MKSAIALILVMLLAAAGLGAAWTAGHPAPAALVAVPPAPTSTPAFGGLPGRSTGTPPTRTPLGPGGSPTPAITSPFVFPTTPPEISPTPSQDCTGVFPLDNVEAITFGTTTLVQLEAAFGHATRVSGRANRFSFADEDCALIVLIGTDEAIEAELTPYGTLDLLLDRYGLPAAVGVSQGNLTLLDIGNAVLLYPDQGVIAIFNAAPEDLTGDMLVARLIFMPPFTVDQQLRRLNVRVVDDWQPPLR